MPRTELLPLVPSVVALVCFAFASACAKESLSAPPPPPPPVVGVTPIAVKDVASFDELPGRIEAIEEVELRAQVTGAVVAVKFREGALVKRGDVLFVIDARAYRAILARTRAEQTRAATRYELARTEAARTERLVESGAIPRREHESYTSAATQALAEVGAANAAAQLAAVDVDHAVIRAPIDGRVGRALVSVGDIVGPAAGVLTTLVSVDPVRVAFTVDEETYLRYAARLHTGEKVGVQVGTSADTGYPYEGAVDFVANRLDASTGSIELRARLADPTHALTPGLYARVRLAAGTAPSVVIDERAILTDQDRRYVLSVDAKGVAQRKDVSLGRALDGKRVITKGLVDGDRVIVSNIARVMPGAPVTVEPRK